MKWHIKKGKKNVRLGVNCCHLSKKGKREMASKGRHTLQNHRNGGIRWVPIPQKRPRKTLVSEKNESGEGNL